MTKRLQESALGPAPQGLAHEEDDDDIPSNPSTEPPLAELIGMRLGRRTALKGLAAVTTVAAFGAPLFGSLGGARAATSSLTFEEIPHALEKGVRVAPGYGTSVLIRWGDKVTANTPGFDVGKQTAAAQEKQFGYNNDFMAFMPLPKGSTNSDNGLLCVSHEYTNPHLMWPVGGKKGSYDRITKDQVAVEMAAHGHSIVEIRKAGGTWRVVGDSTYNRRITTLSTPMRVSGPAAGHDRMKTKADPTGKRIIGTLNNCAGGTTPWNTVLIAEENFHNYFRGDPRKTPEARNYKRYGFKKGKARWAWGEHVARFNVEKEPNEANRFGWIVEIDPYDPASTPVKRTALGRFKHECATTAVNADGRVSVYSGDDQRFDYLYRFVTDRAYDPANSAANRDLLDSGTLYAGKFDSDGTMTWLPLVFGNGPLTAANGFNSQADVLIETRRAADLMGATPMDRCEDVETNPVNGRTYVMCTNNTKRKQKNAANPRAKNKHGHIIELIPPTAGGKADHTAAAYRWEFFLLGGDPANPKDGAKYLADISANGWLSTPDNCTFDGRGRIWITTDGQPKSGFSDSVYAADTEGGGRGLTRCFFNAPRGAEICGPTFTPDHRTLFVAIQHPADDKGSTFTKPSTRWPDFDEGMPPRPSVVAITKDDGGVIGS
ncbi:MAG: PhoX family phosphatase [Kiloniellales bacterium]